MQVIPVGLAGCGTVGAGVVKHLHHNAALLQHRLGLIFEISKIAVRDPKKARAVAVPQERLTQRLDDLIEDPHLPIVIELIGGIEPARSFIRKAILAGKIVITGNKALLAEEGPELFQLAHQMQVPLFFEAAVAGGIPILKSIRESFIGNRFESIHAILNGTSNFILTQMQEKGLDFQSALQQAQNQGYAEADPTLDVNGWDAAHKAIILASLAYGCWIEASQVYVEGIEKITLLDIQFTDTFGYCIKLLTTLRLDADQRIEVRVCPTLLPKSHVLASVRDVFNAIWLRGDVVGESLFYGRGAGQDPTASSILGDLAEAAWALKFPRPQYGLNFQEKNLTCKSHAAVVSQFYLRLMVEDQPGILATVSGILADAKIGIASVLQPESHHSGPVPLILMLHQTEWGKVTRALKILTQLPGIVSPPLLLPVETFAQ